ncbi:11790_t:CDS:1, partial [Dentiscutata erythropus]
VQESRTEESKTEELENEIAEDDELIISGKTDLDDLLQKFKGLQ